MNQRQRGHRHIELVAAAVFQHQILGGDAAGIEPLQTEVAANALLHVHHRGADLQAGEIAQQRVGVAHPLRPRAADGGGGRAAGQGGFGDDAIAVVGVDEALVDRAQHHAEALGLPLEFGPAVQQRRRQAVAAQAFDQHFPTPCRLGHEQDPAFGGGAVVQHRFGGLGQGADGRTAFDALEGQQPVERLARVEVERLGRQQRVAQVAGIALKTFANLLPVTVELVAQVAGHEQSGVGRQVVGQTRGVVEEQGQIRLDAAGHHALADLAVDAAAGRIAGKGLAVAAPKAFDAVAVGGELPRRQQMNMVHLVLAALRVGVEGADAFDVFIEQVDAVGDRGAHGKQIEQRAAHGELALGLDLGDRRIAGMDQPLAKTRQRQTVAHLEVEATAVQPRPGRQALHGTVGRGQQQRRLAIGQRGERGHALRHHLLMR